jgi:small subunit ribosomal protein S6
MNIECGRTELDELASAFRFNDAVIRNMVMARDEAVTEPSPLIKSKDERGDRDDDDRGRRQDRDDGDYDDRPRRGRDRDRDSDIESAEGGAEA